MKAVSKPNLNGLLGFVEEKAVGLGVPVRCSGVRVVPESAYTITIRNYRSYR